ncbi:MAG: hypothetical protein WC011_03680 [Candidatus Paceibacterota bacterium]
MDLDKIINSNNLAQAGSLYETKFLNLEYLFYQIYVFLYKFFGLGSGSGNAPVGLDGSGEVSGSVAGSSSGTFYLDLFTNFLYLLILLFTTVLFYCIIRVFEIRDKEGEYMNEQIRLYAEKQKAREQKIQNAGAPKNPRWLAVTEYINSENQNDWRLAIIEADSMLESLVDNLGFKGDTFGEKLKSIDPNKFKSLSALWDAHNVRNRIAHEGTEFGISHYEAKRVISIYEQIFRDYAFI